jgi:hypothetical protein
VRGGGTIDDDDVRRRLADLLEVCSQTALYEALNVRVRDKIAALSNEITRAGNPGPDEPARPARRRWHRPRRLTTEYRS